MGSTRPPWCTVSIRGPAVGELGGGFATLVVCRPETSNGPRALAAALDGLAREGRPVMAVVAPPVDADRSFDDLERIGTRARSAGCGFKWTASTGASALRSQRLVNGWAAYIGTARSPGTPLR